MSLFSFNLLAKTKIAIIDTGFCSQHTSKKKIIIEKNYDATNSLNDLKCNSKSLTEARFHGENVLQTFLKNLKIKDLEIYPIIVFDSTAQSKKEYWEKAIIHLNYIQPNLIITGSGLINQKLDFPESLNSIWVMAAPRISPFIKQEDNIFPQSFSHQKNMYLVGSYFDGNIIDPGFLYKDKIKFFEKDTNEKFNSSSRAVGIVAAKILNHCSTKLKSDLDFCLSQNSLKTSEEIKELK